jgi:sialate O-acetylesterase
VKRLICATLAVATGLVLSPAVRADVRPHPLISDGMVLQRGMKCPLWGTASPGEEVSVALDMSGQGLAAKPAKADQDGKWRIELPELKAGGPYKLHINGKNKLTIKDVYVGEVWIASGQSNMEWSLAASANAEKTIKESKNPQIRLFTVAKMTSAVPLVNVTGQWSECNPKTVGSFSAVAYFFGRDLHRALGVPIGLIHSSWGGTVAEAWTGRSMLEQHPSLKYLTRNTDQAVAAYEKNIDTYLANLEKYLTEARRLRAAGKPVPPPPAFPANPAGNPNTATVLYNAMIKPLQPYGIRGVIWYQGESNAGRAYEYRTLFPAMIQNWRQEWGEGDFPFLFVQLAPWRAYNPQPMESDWAELREAQMLTTRKLKNTAMAVITDVGDEKDIHPRQKEPVGARLALAARALAYGEKIAYSGPLYDSMKIEGNKVVLNFTHVGTGLEARGGELKGFTIAGADKKFHNAQAKIEGDKVIVWSDAVEKPVAVRYGWANFPVVNLWNKEGLPASPFRTDDFVMITGPKSAQPSK